MHANETITKRNLDHRIKFVVADIEDLSQAVPDGVIDRVISNGAFCLVGRKEQAFREVYRVLKSKGIIKSYRINILSILWRE